MHSTNTDSMRFVRNSFLFLFVVGLLVSFLTNLSVAQIPTEFTVTGRILDTAQKPLTGARILLLRGAVDLKSGSNENGQPRAMTMDPNSLAGGAVAAKDGSFAVKVKGAGTYTVVVSSIGYSAFQKVIALDKEDSVRVPGIIMKPAAVKTGAVEVSEQAVRAEIKGDTVEYNASQFKTERNAVAEDLVRKMPGVQVESDGSVKAQGETVRRVMVDGKPFFGDDPKTALKNLPAEMIERVQVLDQMSDQSRFSGFDDGDRTKTLNIITKPDRRNGQFGKVYGGIGGSAIGAEPRYTAGGNVNFFGGDRRISVLGLSNNINQQNFAISDILGAMGGGGMNTQIRTAVSNAMGSGMGAMMRGAGGGGGGGVGSPGDFLVSPSDGITAAHSLGLNYADKWSPNFDVAASYFGNLTSNTALQNSLRQTLLTDGSSQRTGQNYYAQTQNINHRINARFEYTLDSNNSFILTPAATLQNNNSTKITTNATSLGEATKLNASKRTNLSESQGYSLTNELLWRHKFNNEGRTLSISQRTSLNRNLGEQNNEAVNTFYRYVGTTLDSTQLALNQEVPSTSNTLTLGGNISYTEPLGKGFMLQASYNINQTRSESDRRTMDFNRATSEYSILNQTLSNVASSLYTTHRPGVMLRFSPFPMLSLAVGADYQYARLDVSQTYPRQLELSRDFQNILPSLAFNMPLGRMPQSTNANAGTPGGNRPPFGGFGGGGGFGGPGGGGPPAVFMQGNMANMMNGPVGNLRFNYRTFTNQPGIRQLQNVVDNSDPVRLTLGNPELKQELTHNITANVGLFDMKSATSVFGFISASYTADKIVNSTILPLADTLITNTVTNEKIPLQRGGQLTRPVNVDGYWTVRGFGGYNFPVEPAQGFKLNISLNLGASYVRDITFINSQNNTANTYGIAPQIGIGSNISENLDFNISARTQYNIARNSLQSSLDNEYFVHTVNARMNWIFWEGFLLNVDFNYLSNVGLVGGFNQNIPLLNLGIGKRFWDGNGELKFSVFDALNQNNSITRNITSAYIEDTQTSVLQRYFLLTFTYNLRMATAGS